MFEWNNAHGRESLALDLRATCRSRPLGAGGAHHVAMRSSEGTAF